jgi:hypothetical protein
MLDLPSGSLIEGRDCSQESRVIRARKCRDAQSRLTGRWSGTLASLGDTLVAANMIWSARRA